VGKTRVEFAIGYEGSFVKIMFPGRGGCSLAVIRESGIGNLTIFMPPPSVMISQWRCGAARGNVRESNKATFGAWVEICPKVRSTTTECGAG
jgi:hypothetical protein